MTEPAHSEVEKQILQKNLRKEMLKIPQRDVELSETQEFFIACLFAHALQMSLSLF